MVLSPAQQRLAGAGGPADATPPRAVLWHDLECASYTADLPLWEQLAREAGAGPGSGRAILDIGAGTGRVALALARGGHGVCALDRDAELLDALRERAAGLPVGPICADARSFELERRDFALCIAPMQTVQLLGGSAGRLQFLARARSHLRPGGLLACAIVTAFDTFDCGAGDPAPAPETVRFGQVTYSSHPLCVRTEGQRVVIERERRLTVVGQTLGESNRVALDLFSAAELEREGAQVGLQAAPARALGATAEHVGSEVVVLRA